MTLRFSFHLIALIDCPCFTTFNPSESLVRSNWFRLPSTRQSPCAAMVVAPLRLGFHRERAGGLCYWKRPRRSGTAGNLDLSAPRRAVQLVVLGAWPLALRSFQVNQQVASRTGYISVGEVTHFEWMMFFFVGISFCWGSFWWGLRWWMIMDVTNWLIRIDGIMDLGSWTCQLWERSFLEAQNGLLRVFRTGWYYEQKT